MRRSPGRRGTADHKGVAGTRRDDLLLEGLTGCDALLGYPGDDPAGLARVVTELSALQWVHGSAAGTGEQARRAGLSAADLDRVAVTTSAGAHGEPLAEFAVFGLLAFHKGLDRLLAAREQHAWPARWAMTQLQGRRLLVVGLGAIGRQVAVRAAALGMSVTAVRRHPEGDPPDGVHRVVGMDGLAEAVASAQDVVLSLPGTPATDGLVDAGLLARLPAGGVLVNVGRGSVVDEPALADALRSGHLRGAVLDVAATEPRPADDPLWELPTLLQSPHTAALSASEDRRIVELFLANLVRLQAGEPLRHRVRAGDWY